MDFFEYRNGSLFCEEVSVEELAKKHGTPLYVYSLKTFLHHFGKLSEAFSGVESLICFSVKSNSNLSILRRLQQAGCGFDVVSGGEIFRALKAGADPGTIVFAGVGKTDEEILYALKTGIKMFDVESLPELENIDRLARAEGVRAPIALRLNPDVDAHVHRYITTGKQENKFGLAFQTAKGVLLHPEKFPACDFIGIHTHIGSQILTSEPYAEAVSRVIEFLEGIDVKMEYLNIGGGFGITYKGEAALEPKKFAEKILPIVRNYGAKLILEPGRFMSGNAGVLVTKVQYLKDTGTKVFAICDAGMNDLIRPALYEAYHLVWPVKTGVLPPRLGTSAGNEKDLIECDIVGPICESGDFFAQKRRIPAVKSGDFLAIFSAGAYAMTMASNYNSRPLAEEILVENDISRVIRKRQTLEDLIKWEENLP